MPPTVYTPEDIAMESTIPTIEIAATVTADWEPVFDAYCLTIDRRTAQAGPDMAVFEYRYGQVKHPNENAAHAREKKNLDGMWIKVSIGDELIFLGRITSDSSNPQGDETGRQTFTALGPLHLLRRIHIADSRWDDPAIGADPIVIQWVPVLNDPTVAGGKNRDAAGLDLFGSGTAWTHKQYLKYLIDRYIDPSIDNGPTWTLGGELAALNDSTDAITFRQCSTAADHINQIINKKRGLGWTIDPQPAGFEIRVFSLAPRQINFGAATLQTNPNTSRAVTGEDHGVSAVTICRSVEDRYSKIRLYGGRVVVCATAYGAGVKPHAASTTLETDWDALDENDYRLPPGDLTAEGYDEIRNSERFANVYRHFVVPWDWDYQFGRAIPEFKPDGTLLGDRFQQLAWQQTKRRTLNWLPLRHGDDHTFLGWDIDEDATAELRRPLVLIGHASARSPFDEDVVQHTPADMIGVGVAVDRDQFGFTLQCAPGHLLAKTEWAGTIRSSNYHAHWYHKNLIFTFAFESDVRLFLEYDVPGVVDGGTLEVVEDSAQCWVLAPSTVVGVDDERELIVSPPWLEELRTDAEKLQQKMTGLIARYADPRVRSTIKAKGLWPWSPLLGTTLSSITTAGVNETVGGPITAIRWNVRDQSTTVKGGYAW